MAALVSTAALYEGLPASGFPFRTQAAEHAWRHAKKLLDENPDIRISELLVIVLAGESPDLLPPDFTPEDIALLQMAVAWYRDKINPGPLTKDWYESRQSSVFRCKTENCTCLGCLQEYAVASTSPGWDAWFSARDASGRYFDPRHSGLNYTAVAGQEERPRTASLGEKPVAPERDDTARRIARKMRQIKRNQAANG